MKTKKIIKIKINPLNIVKETQEERKERVRQSGNSYHTRIVPNKKKEYKRKSKYGEKEVLDNV